jgi:hypothetical protein
VIGDEGARIIARDALLPHHGSRGRVVRVSVDRRQRRRGLGRTAVDDLVRRARHREMSEVLATTDTPGTAPWPCTGVCGFTELVSSSRL